MGKHCDPLTKAQALVLYSVGLSYRQAGRMLGVTHGAVMRWCDSDTAEKYRVNCRESKRKWRKENPEEAARVDKAWRDKNPGYSARYARIWTARNLELSRERNRIWRQKNPEKMSKCNRRYRENNPDAKAANAARYRASKRQAVPPWTTDEHRAKEREIYAEAIRLTKETGIQYHTDHIHPLKAKKLIHGKWVDFACGLHVYWNLRPIPGAENIRKWARFPEDEPPTAW